MVDIVRTSLGRLLESSRGDSFLPVRVSRDLARRLNRTLGEPVCTAEELEKRRQAKARLEELKRSSKPTEKVKVQAPVMIYFEKDRNARELARMEELLQAKGITYEKLDVSGDEATQAFVAREAKVKGDDLPVVFVAGDAVGPYPALVAFDVSGKLEKALFGA
jgi:glutaredoxin